MTDFVHTGQTKLPINFAFFIIFISLPLRLDTDVEVTINVEVKNLVFIMVEWKKKCEKDQSVLMTKELNNTGNNTKVSCCSTGVNKDTSLIPFSYIDDTCHNYKTIQKN